VQTAHFQSLSKAAISLNGMTVMFFPHRDFKRNRSGLVGEKWVSKPSTNDLYVHVGPKVT